MQGNTELVRVELAKIKPYKNNPRKNDNAVQAVAESIRQCGYIAPIVVDEDYTILAGHTRYKALLSIGRKEADVIVRSGLSDDQKRKYRLLDNKTGEIAEWDMAMLADELNGLDFGELDLDWGIQDAEGLDLDDTQGSLNNDGNIETIHCPKCGFEFAV